MFWLFNYFQNKRFLVYSCKRKKENLPSNELLEINLQFDEFENFRRLRSVVDIHDRGKKILFSPRVFDLLSRQKSRRSHPPFYDSRS